MANPEHIALIKQGVKVWNQWRLENFGVTPDLREANLSDLDLKGADLFHADLRGGIHQ